MSSLKIKLLGEFGLSFAGEPVHTLGANRLQSLLAYLLVYRHSPQPRQQIAAHLWPDTAEKQARTNLRNLLHQLKKAFPSHDSYLHIERKTLQWRNDAEFTLDIAEFESLLDVDSKSTGTAQSSFDSGLLERYQEAILLYKADLVPSLYDDWALHERERYRQLYLSALRDCSRGLEAQREYSLATQVAMRLVSADPLQESTYRQLMRLHAVNSDRGAILQTYQQCAAQLEQELEVEPSPETIELRDALLQGVAAGIVEVGNLADQSLQKTNRYRSNEIQPDEPVWHRKIMAAEGGEQIQSFAGLPSETFAQSERVEVLGTPDLASIYRLLVGRQSEWAILREAWQRTQNGHSHIVVIRGEAGIGKSRLAEELVTWVRQQGASVAVSYCYTAQKNIPYGPVIRWLRSHVFSSTLATVDKKWLTEVARLLPELGSDIPQFETVGPITEGWQRRHLFESLIQIINGVGGPLLLFIDDIQWSDVESLAWLSSLLHEHRIAPVATQNQTPVLILATLRDEEAQDTPTLQTWYEELQRHGLLTDVTLGPLNQENALLLASDVSISPLSTEEGAKLFKQTEGHPLFIVESVRAGMNFGAAAGQELPDSIQSKTESTAAALSTVHSTTVHSTTVHSTTIQSVIKTRFRMLSKSTQALLNLASVIGREFSYHLLVDASDIDEHDIIDGLDEALERGIVREQEEETYDFSHILLREALYDELSNARRRFHHKTVAEVLESSAKKNMDAVAGQIAQHFEESGNHVKAMEYYLRAATAAQNVYANEEALSYYQHLLSANLSHNLTVANRCQILTEAGQIWSRIGQWHDAMGHFNQLLEVATKEELIKYQAIAHLGIARLEKDEGKYAEALQRLELAHTFFTSCNDLWGLADTLDLMGEIYFFFSNAELTKQTYEHQWQIGEQVESALIKCRAQYVWMLELLRQGSFEQALEIGKEAFALAKHHSLLQMQAKIAIAMARILYNVNSPTAHWEWQIKALNYAQSLGNQELIIWSVTGFVLTARNSGDFYAASRCTLYALTGSIKIRNLTTTTISLSNYADARILYGAFDSTEELLVLSLALEDYLQIPIMRLATLESLAWFYWETEQFDRLLTFTEQYPDALLGVGRAKRNSNSIAFTIHLATARQQLLDGVAPDEALSVLRQRLVKANSQPEPNIESVASLHYWLWFLNSNLEADREEAEKLYYALYEKHPIYQFRQRYQKLTGLSLPALPPLDLPAIITEEEYDMESLLAKVHEWLAELQDQAT